MTDPDNRYRKVVIIDTIDDPKVTLPDPKPCRPARELFTSTGTGIIREGTDSGYDPPAILRVPDPLEFLHCGRLDRDPIICHAASGL